jgi:hypothetical protein
MKVFALTIFSALLVYVLSLSARAADPVPPPPVEVKSAPTLPSGVPIKIRAPDNLKWDIIFFKADVARPGDAASEKLILVPGHTITVYKTPSFLYEEETTEKTVFSRWYRGRTEIIREGPDKQFFPIDANEQVPNMPKLSGKFGKSDFVGFGWISRQNFRGLKTLPSGDCLVFSDEVAIPHAIEEAAPDASTPTKVQSLKVTAWIDAKTRLPVRLQRGKEIQVFHFSLLDNPQGLPPEVQRLFKINETVPPQGRALAP